MNTKEFTEMKCKMTKQDIEKKREELKYQLESLQDETEKNLRQLGNSDRVNPSGDQLLLISRTVTKKAQQLEGLTDKLNTLKSLKESFEESEEK